jgi:hypothetical protein
MDRAWGVFAPRNRPARSSRVSCIAFSAARFKAASISSKSIPRGLPSRFFMAHHSMDARVKPGHDGGY